jgi:tryptophan 2,3-dioxygenase
MTNTKPQRVDYAGYLSLEKLLSIQNPESRKAGREAHDEMLFIIVHQTYELWFAQILHELNSVRNHFLAPKLQDEALGPCVDRLDRVTKIQRLMLDQVGVLETMTPMDFLDFRDLLYPASGFQSFQFRMVENRLGLQADKRVQFDREGYLARLTPSERIIAEKAETEASLFTLIESWLERTPFLQMKDFSFWQSYRSTVDQMLAADQESIQKNPHLNDQSRVVQLEQLAKTRASFEVLYDEAKMKAAISDGRWRLSHKATLAALFIFLYRDEPALQLPYKLLSLMTDIDEGFTAWRSRHAQMALRMIGTKIGTGGSSGAEYLAKSAATHRVFHDLSRLATFLIPRRNLPRLPAEVKSKLAFQYQL